MGLSGRRGCEQDGIDFREKWMNADELEYGSEDDRKNERWR